MTQALDTKIDNERKPWPNLIGEACRVRTFVLGCNTVAGLVGSSSHATLLVFF